MTTHPALSSVTPPADSSAAPAATPAATHNSAASAAPCPLLARRTSGVLLHVTSLPGRHGSGDLGESARHFVDWLVSAGQTLWQVLPLTPAGPGQSPYQSVSAFAGNPLLVNLDELSARGWLRPLPDADLPTQQCDFDRVVPWRMACLREAWEGFQRDAWREDREAFAAFSDAHSAWLDDYARFMVLDARHGTDWTAWPPGLAAHHATALAVLDAACTTELGFWRFVQWCFWTQWQALGTYARERGVHLVGDVPIFVSHHSADVWARQHEYQLDASGQPTVVAGVPPDYFSETGQRWGNPLYDWNAMARDGYAWWVARLRHLLACVDVVRLDHFRGLEAYWAIPASESTALNGQWVPGPGLALLDALRAALGGLPLIAEDLGLITPEVVALREAAGLAGMRILQFAFGGDANNPYLPHNHTADSVVYTGTHDNDTTVGWWQQADDGVRTHARDYLGPEADALPHLALTRVAWQSVARTAIVPFQDVLGLDGSHRMNTPGLAEGCWRWRFEWSQVGPEPARWLRRLTNITARLHTPAQPTPHSD